MEAVRGGQMARGLWVWACLVFRWGEVAYPGKVVIWGMSGCVCVGE